MNVQLHTRALRNVSPIRRGLAASAGFLLTLAAVASAQVAPGPGHTTSGAGAGMDGAVSPTGGFAAAVPLDLPSPRGSVPIPLSIVYTGSARAGAAGQGWDVPLTYVRRSTSVCVFRRQSGADAGGDGLWLLAEVRDPIGGDKVVLRYDVPRVQGCSAGVALRSLAYTFDAAGTTPLYEVELDYQPYWRPPLTRPDSTYLRECARRGDEAAYPFEHVAEDHLSFDRAQVLRTVRVKARNNLVPSWAPKVIRAYQLDYDLDPTNQRPRLSTVTTTGEEGVAGSTLPVATYRYGTLAQVDAADAAPRIRFVEPVPVARNFLPGTSFTNEMSTTEVTVTNDDDVRTERSRARHMIRDFTGDGLPDLVYKVGDQWLLHQNRLTAGGPQFGGVAMTWAQPSELFEQTTTRRTDSGPEARAAMITTQTWNQFTDWDGDGRLDVIDVKGGSDVRYWKVWLNRRAADGGIEWHPVQVDITPLRNHLRDAPDGAPFVRHDERVAIDRAQSWPRYDRQTCTIQSCLGSTCGPAVDCPDGESPDGFPPVPSNHDFSSHVDTLTDWMLKDLNGDGFLDFVAGTFPVRQHETGEWSPVDGGGVPVCTDTPSGIGNPVTRRCFFRHTQWIDAMRWSGLGGEGTPAFLAGSERAAFLNRHGAFQGINESPFAPKGQIGGDAYHGVARWTSGNGRPLEPESPPVSPAASPGLSWQSEGYADPRGDGVATVRTYNSYSPDNVMPAFDNDGYTACVDDDVFSSRQVSGEADLDGDGLGDLFQRRGASFEVRFNVGAGYGPARVIEPPGSMPFELSLTTGRCGSVGRNTAGLTDLDGDGKPELLRIVDGGLWMSRLDVGSGAGPLDAQRLVSIDNRYGAVTYVKYRNAKADSLTSHDVPFPEIVVGETGTLVLDGSGPHLAPTYYAYGGATMVYDPLAVSWVFPGYRRQVALRGKTERAGDVSITGMVTITDRDPTAPAGSTYDQQVTAGRVGTVSRFEMTMVPRPELLLGWNGTPIHAQATQTHGAVVFSDQQGGGPPVVAPEALECGDLDPFTGELVGTGMCRTAGVVQTRSNESWEGSAAPPSLANVMSGSVVTSGDQFGRPTRLVGKGDLRRTDDDVCTEIMYATPASDEKFLVESAFPSVVSSIVLTDCGWGRAKDAQLGTPTILSAAHFRYDGLPLGQVERGRLTARDVDRYGPDGFLDGHEVEAFTYNELGEIESSTSTRSLSTGATQATWFAYDDFGATVTQLGTQASDTTANLVATAATSTWPSSGSRETDHAGVTTEITYDGHGRMLREIAKTATQKTTRRRFQYQDATIPRRLILETYPGTTPAGAEDAATDRVRAHTTLDALGRTRFTQVELGGDYGNSTLVSGFTRFDELGRPVYEAAPFEAPMGFSPVSTMVLPYGTTTKYDGRGRVTRVITAQGLNETASNTNVAADTYVRHVGYGYESGMGYTSSRGGDESDPGSPRYGAHDDTWSTAIGRQVRRVRATASGTWLDRVDQEWDRLARVTQTKRFLIPGVSAGAVVWQSTFDSLGNRLSLSEPGVATKTFEYDELGNEIGSWWMDGTTRRSVVSQYDGLGRMTSRLLMRTPAGDMGTVESHDRMTWDTHAGGDDQPESPLLGRLSAVETVGVGSVFYGYDDHGRTSSTTYRYLAHGERVRESANFSAGGRLTGIDFETPRISDQVTYQHDSAGRVRKVRVNDETLFDAAEVTAKGQYRRVAYGNGVGETFNYAPNGPEELLDWSAVTGTGTYRSTNLGHDGAGRITMESHETPASTMMRAYAFDDLGRVTRSIQFGGVGAGQESYTHDPLGNVLTRTATTGASNRAYSFDPADPDRLCRADAPGGGGSGCQFTYDGAGNITIDRTTPGFQGMRLYRYDAANRIVQARRSVYATAGFWYGPAGLARSSVSSMTSARTIWHFGGLIEEVDHYDGTTGAHRLQTQRRIPGPLGIVASLRTDRAGNTDTVYAHGDARGSRFFTDADGTVIQDATYSLFGKVTSDSGDPTSLSYTDDLWNGGAHIPELGITIIGARVYDPELGRFLQRDPLMLTQRSVTANPYAFAFNDPVNLTDPSGMGPEGSPIGVYQECFICTSGGTMDASNSGVEPVAVADGKGVPVFHMPIGEIPRVRQSRVSGAPGGRVARILWRHSVFNPEANLKVVRGFVKEATTTVRHSVTVFGNCLGNVVCAVGTVGFEAIDGLGQIDVSSLSPSSVAAAVCPDGDCNKSAGRGLFMIMAGGEGAVGGSADDVARAAARGGGAAGAPAVILDTNAVIAAVEKGEISAILQGRSPVVPITAAKEFLQGGGSANALRTFLRLNGGRLGLAGREDVASRLRTQASVGGRSLGLGDSRIAASASREGLSVVTRDRQFRNFLGWVGLPAESF